MDRLRHLATVSVARASGFAGLAILCVMVGFAADVVQSFKVGGVLALIVSLALALKAAWASRRPYKRTELWLMLEPAERPLAHVAQRLISGVLRATFHHFALIFARLSALFFTFAASVSLLRSLPA
jgi:hypothetical protein